MSATSLLVAKNQMDDIVAPILNMMKDCYLVATRDAHVLDEAIPLRFQRIGTGNGTTVLQHNFSDCRVCDNRMALKQQGGDSRSSGNERRSFLFSATCREGYVMPRSGQIRPKTQDCNPDLPVRCPICCFQMISIAHGD
jgi:hypothetical protein